MVKVAKENLIVYAKSSELLAKNRKVLKLKYSTIDLKISIPDQPMLFEGDSLYARLQALEDQRACRGRLYELAPILFMALLANLRGHNQLAAIAQWAKLRVNELSAFSGLKRLTMPHKTKWGRPLMLKPWRN